MSGRGEVGVDGEGRAAVTGRGAGEGNTGLGGGRSGARGRDVLGGGGGG